MTRRSLLASLLLCLSLSAMSNPGLAQAGRETGDDPIAKMERAGWKIAGEGVLRREPRAGEVETFVFGVEGFTWKLRDLRGQLRFLREQFKANPTPELRRAIASHRKVIASTLEMIERARIAEASGESKAAWIEECPDPAFSFAYDAAASLKTQRQGTWANASADFSVYAPCVSSSPDFNDPPAGEVYSYAFAKTTVNGAPTTATVTDGPRSGSNVNASADANRNGGAPCESYAYSSVTSTALNPSSYTRSQLNESCLSPSVSAPPLQVTVTSDQPSSISHSSCTSITWTVNVSGGTPPYNSKIYQNNLFITHGTTYSKLLCGDTTRTIRVEVTDSGGQSGSSFHTTSTSVYQCPPPKSGSKLSCLKPL